MKCLIHSFAKTLFKYCFRVANFVFNKLYNNSYDNFAVISIAWSWFSCKDNLSALFIKNTSLYSFNSMSKVCILSTFVIWFITLFIAFTWCLMINSLTTLIIIKAYIVNSFYRAFAKSSAMNNLNAYSFILKCHVFTTVFIWIHLNCIFNMLKIKKNSFLLIA